MIDFYKQGMFIKSIEISKEHALKVIKIMTTDTGIPWTFRETPYLNQKRT